MNNDKPSSGPRTRGTLFLAGSSLLFAAATLILAASGAGQDSADTSERGQGRTVAVVGPIHATVAAGKVLAPSAKFAPVSLRGSRAH